MKKHVSKLLLLLILSVFTLSVFAAVSEYSFASTLGTYTEISGGTVHGTAANDNECFLAIPLGFTFTYNGVAYTNASIATNGFVAMGDVVLTSNVAISAATGTNNIVAGMNRDIKSRDNGSLMSLTTGAAPNRVFVVQWTHYRRVPTTTANDDFSFQIQLHESSNAVRFVYGPFIAVTQSTAAATQVGMRGDSNADFNNRTTTTDWSATTAGTANNNSCTLSSTVFPANGLTFTFTPPTTGEPPMPAQNPNPANNAMNVAITANLSWLAGGGTTDGYKIYLGTNNPPDNIVNGSQQTATTFDPDDFSYSTVYYWKIVPFNQNGDALNCPVWTFTTLADPTITTYPYNENFDTLTPPALPVGWITINANNDPYSWESYVGNAQSTPNSMRIRYNTTVDMNDWLVTPPMQFTQGMFYKVKFYYRANSATYPEQLSLYWGNAPNVAGLTNMLWENNNITNTTYNMTEVVLQATTTGIHYLGFHGHSPMNMFYIYLDTFSVSLVVDSMNPPTNLAANVTGNSVVVSWNAPQTRDLLGYKVYRDAVLINTITNPATLNYFDQNLPVGTYAYTVTAVYTSGESVPAGPVSATVLPPLDPPTNLTATVVNGNNVHLAWQAPTGPPPVGFNDGFETYPNFATTFAPWTCVDVDLSATYTMQNVTWAGAGLAMSYMVFNPSATTPPITTFTAHTGAKMAVAIASTTPPNNDWMITPQTTITAGDVLSFWARSLTAQYGLERFKIGVSTTGTAPANFTIISGATHIEAPIAWTLYSYNLDAYAGQNVYIGFQCVSNDAWIFMVDDVHVGPPTNREDYPYVAVNTSDIYTRVKGTPTPAVPSDPQSLNPTRELLGYKVYRGGSLIATVTGATTVVYDDMALPVGTYSYTVSALYSTGESVPTAPATATINPVLNPPVNLTAAVDNTTVNLAWEVPGTPASEWIHYDSGENNDSIGTGAAADFDVAIRFPASALTAYVGTSLQALKVWPAQAGTFSVRVWTGGTPTAAGAMVVDQAFTPTLDTYNTVILNNPVPITGTGELWFGYRCNVTSGYPAGCDAGPAINGFGNMMYWQNAWTTLLALAPTLNYNWNIQGYVGMAPPTEAPVISMPSVVSNHTSDSRAITTGILGSRGANKLQSTTTKTAKADIPAVYHTREYNRTQLGYKVYRDGSLISTIQGPAVTTYSDTNLQPGTYSYTVTANYDEGESAPAGPVQAIIEAPLAPAFYTATFENYPDFALAFYPWTLLDIDQSDTYGIQNVTFPNSGSPMAYMIFNPSATTPPVTSVVPHGGAKMAASFASSTPINNDWMVSPRVHLGTNSAVRFYARSHTAQYGLERFRVGVSTMPQVIPQGFQYITGATYVEAPVAWTEYLYDLSTYDNQDVYIGIRCVSDDAFIFYVDDFTIHSNGGSDNDDIITPVVATELKGNYPNPFNPETTISYSVMDNMPVAIEIYNTKGQKVKTLVNETKAAGNHSVTWKGLDDNNRPVASGVYFFKMNAGKYSSTKKMIMMK